MTYLSTNQPHKFVSRTKALLMEIKQQIAKAIREAREAADYTQEHVSEELGMSTSNYSKIERGVNALRMETAIQLCRLYGIGMDELIGNRSDSAGMVQEESAKYGRQVPEQVVFVFNGAGKNSPKAERFLRRLTEVMRDFDSSDYEDFLEKDED